MMKKINYRIILSTCFIFALGCVSTPKNIEESANEDISSAAEVSPKETAPKQMQSEAVQAVRPPDSAAKSTVSKSAPLAMAEYKKGRFDVALNHINRAIKEQPAKSEYYHNMGLIYLAKGEQREALKAFRKGMQINPQDDAIASQLGAIFTKEKDYIKAEIALESAAEKGSQDASVLNNYAIALTANKKIDQAEKIYEKALKQNPNSRDIMLNYSIFLIDQRQKNKQALDLLSRLKFVGVQSEVRNIINVLENRAKAGLK